LARFYWRSILWIGGLAAKAGKEMAPEYLVDLLGQRRQIPQVEYIRYIMIKEL
jgi:hypothetical protein